MTNGAEKEKRRKKSFCKPAKSIAMGLSRVFIGFYTSSSYECIRMFWMQICKHELFVCLGWQSLDIIRHADTRTGGHALNIIFEIKLSISLVLISFAINAIGFVSCLPIINESTTHPFPSLSLSLTLCPLTTSICSSSGESARLRFPCWLVVQLQRQPLRELSQWQLNCSRNNFRFQQCRQRLARPDPLQPPPQSLSSWPETDDCFP